VPGDSEGDVTPGGLIGLLAASCPGCSTPHKSHYRTAPSFRVFTGIGGWRDAGWRRLSGGRRRLAGLGVGGVYAGRRAAAFSTRRCGDAWSPALTVSVTEATALQDTTVKATAGGSYSTLG